MATTRFCVTCGKEVDVADTTNKGECATCLGKRIINAGKESYKKKQAKSLISEVNDNGILGQDY